ncbi:MAG: hypothetical protein ACI4IL_02215 [Eubacterium sp.]
MTNEKIEKINKIGKASQIIAKICLVFVIIGAVMVGAVSIAAACVPESIANVTVEGSAKVNIDKKYLDIGKMIIQDVNEGMTEEGQTLTIAGSEYEYISADTNENQININYKSTENNLTVRSFAKMLAGICAGLINDIVLICFIIALCKAITNCQSPFEENVIDKMKKLAIALIPWMFIQGIAQSISASAINQNVDINLGLDLGKVLVILVLITLVYVFKYGAILQQESDETL